STVGSPGGGAGVASGMVGGGASGIATSGAGTGAIATSGAGTSGIAGSGSGTPAAIDTSASVLERNKHPSRDGYFTEKTLTKASVKTMALDATFNATFTGQMYASPLYLEQGPGGKGIFIAVTTSNDVFALDETDGHTVWTKNVGPAPNPRCGPVKPVGIESTPVIDPNPSPVDGFATIYVAGAIGPGGVTAHLVHALSAKDGTERAGWPVNVSMIQAAVAQAAGFAFDLASSAQRSSLSLVNGIVYVPYGSYYDCGPYHGWIAAISTADPTKAGAWASGGVGEGIWAAGGMASDGNGVIAVTGNSKGAQMHLDGEEVLRITGLGTLTRNNANIFYPIGTNPANPLWRSMDGADNDFGSNNPVVFPVGGTSYVAAVSKNGHFFLLNAANFGGNDVNNVPPGGAYLRVSSEGMQIHTVMAAYASSMGAHVAFSANGAAGCPKGAGGSSIVSVAASPGPPPALSVAWCVGMTGSQTSPIATTSDGKGADSIVWFVNNGSTLMGVDGDTGAPVASPTGACSAVRAWTSPIAVKGRIVAGGDGHLCSWSPH
ncbi:MAG TPA: hypothetical protein VGY54_14985, partial [Polyangiaceae bacterium]|nr:hypothetical protein [Polyangiaceae bacterium]